ncbi:ammonium transporter [Shewanella halifaxensis HAW-EB4]|uniref:Ammonium transporter n=1 Tax=Shewanella halifaxensis (strain HAW-EB4) TaxID=458817 RepID=B0TQJ7_SHEHH|nr:ammonium transporter [Shewanella halifaxensis]ABZ74990.1 ammonium transporter [Shewanella halifaxensis HAW-EB4]
MSILNTGDTAFMLLCTALVLLMTPGLALFYGGLVRERNMLTIMLQNFICMGVIAIIWVFGGFSLAFGDDIAGVIGSLSQYFGMYHIGAVPNEHYASSIPFIIFFAYQMMFAIITPALMTGAFAGRLQFPAYLKFIILWSLLVYIPVAHWMWGGGFLSTIGAVDFAGGIVVHTTAGMSALAAAVYVGKRRSTRLGETESAASLPLVAIGAGLLWFGWFGFNSGGAYAANQLAAYAFTNTTLAGSTAMLMWMFWEWRENGRPSFSGTLVGAVAGLATITPAAGYVEPASAIFIGLIGATACYFAKAIQKKLGVDDALEVWRAHGVGGILGSLLVGLLASDAIDEVQAGASQFLIQLVAVVVVAIYSWFITTLILKIIDRNGSLKVPDDIQESGLDYAELGSNAYSRDDAKPVSQATQTKQQERPEDKHTK